MPNDIIPPENTPPPTTSKKDSEVQRPEPKFREPEFSCHGCAEPITKDVHDYSMKMKKKPLCKGCQNIQ